MRKIYVAGINGLVGSHVAQLGKKRGYEIVGSPSHVIDFRDRNATFLDLELKSPDALVISAAIVGGIGANVDNPVRFLSENLQIQCNLIDAAHQAKIKKVLFLGSSCIYPKLAEQPIQEEYLLSGKLEPTNQPYALAKISGIELIDSYRKQFGYDWKSAMPCNLYGPGDNFDLASSHVLPALMRKIHNAKNNQDSTVTIWGDGSALREFLFVDDAASGIFHLLESESEYSLFNLGSGVEISIRDLAEKLAHILKFNGKFVFDSSKPNGTPRKLLSSERMKSMGWDYEVGLEDGIERTYSWFLENVSQVRESK